MEQIATGYSTVTKRIRDTRDTAERTAGFIEYTKRVLAGLKDDERHGVRVDPDTIRGLEDTISKHERGRGRLEDLSDQINALRLFGRRVRS